MSVDLRNSAGEEWSISTIGWAFYLNLAMAYGWEPAGTQAPAEWSEEEDQWTGAYDWNAGQRVSAEDGRGFAAALLDYLDDDRRRDRASHLARELGSAIGCEITVEEDDEQLVRGLVALVTRGEFEIW